jgi:outer membrane receptor for ferric coprogen and ferric-rhodotorulic acid
VFSFVTVSDGHQQSRNGEPHMPIATRKRTSVIAAFCALAISAAALADPPAQFDVPAGDLSSALASLSKQANVNLVYTMGDIQGIRTSGVSGALTAADAVRKLLEGTELRLSTDASTGAMLIVPGSAKNAQSSEGGKPVAGDASAQTMLRLAQAGAPADAASTERSEELAEVGVELSEILVLGRGYQNDVTGAKALTPIKETPSSITLISAERIEAQGLITLEDALNKTVGVTAQKIVSSYPRFFARGFEVSSFLLDGVPQQGFAQAPYAVPDLFLFDRIEYLRGPSGLFSGSGSPGGSINLVRKRPKDQFSFTSSVTAGSWSFLRAEADLTGPLNASGSIRGRGAIMYQDAEDFIDTVKKDRKLAFGSVEFDLGEQTTFIVGGFYDDYDSTITVGLPTHLTEGLIDFPRHTFIGGDGHFFRTKQAHAFAELGHEFNERWKVRTSVQHNDLDREEHYIYAVFGDSVNDDNGGLFPMQTFLARHDASNTSADVNLVGAADLFGGLTSGFIFGLDYQRAKWTDEENGYYYGLNDPSLFPIIDVFNPVPRPQMPPIALTPGDLGYGEYLQEREQYGVYGQARLRITEPLTVVLGGRVGWANYTFSYLELVPDNYEISNKFAPYAGVVYDVTDAWSLYSSFAEVFAPQDALDAENQPIGPLSGSQFEAGIKGNVFSDRFLMTLAAYRLRQTNRAIPDPNNFSELIGSGSVEAKGVELEFNGEITPAWSLYGGYVYTTNKFLEAGEGVTGQFIPIIPKHNIRLFSDYDLPGEGVWSRLNVGASVEYSSERGVDVFPAPFSQDGYVVTDLRVGYDLTDEVNVAVNVNNVFDEKYYSSLFNATFGNVYGAPRSVFLTLRAKY